MNNDFSGQMAEWLWRVTQASSLVGVKSISILMGLARGGSNPPLFSVFLVFFGYFFLVMGSYDFEGWRGAEVRK